MENYGNLPSSFDWPSSTAWWFFCMFAKKSTTGQLSITDSHGPWPFILPGRPLPQITAKSLSDKTHQHCWLNNIGQDPPHTVVIISHFTMGQNNFCTISLVFSSYSPMKNHGLYYRREIYAKFLLSLQSHCEVIAMFIAINCSWQYYFKLLDGITYSEDLWPLFIAESMRNCCIHAIIAIAQSLQHHCKVIEMRTANCSWQHYFRCTGWHHIQWGFMASFHREIYAKLYSCNDCNRAIIAKSLFLTTLHQLDFYPFSIVFLTLNVHTVSHNHRLWSIVIIYLRKYMIKFICKSIRKSYFITICNYWFHRESRDPQCCY